MNKEDIITILKEHKSNLIDSPADELEDYPLGFIHGLEYALSMLEERPVLYINEKRQYSDYDVEKFPEYFL